MNMKTIHDKTVCGCLLSIVACLSQPANAAGFYIPEVGSPASLGTGGVANPTNTFGADAAWTNPAGMTGLNRDQIFSGVQAVIPEVEFDSSKATAGGSDGGNAGNTAIIPSFFMSTNSMTGPGWAFRWWHPWAAA
jgi:long-subunit fatty acid transport protein